MKVSRRPPGKDLKWFEYPDLLRLPDEALDISVKKAPAGLRMFFLPSEGCEEMSCSPKKGRSLSHLAVSVKGRKNRSPASREMKKINFSILFCIAFFGAVISMAEPILPEEDAGEPLFTADFPNISISAINCNSLNMSTVTKHLRIRKFYGIASLKTDIVFMSDLRMCNTAGVTD